MSTCSLVLATLLALASPDPEATPTSERTYLRRFHEGWSAWRVDRDADRARAAFTSCLDKSSENPICAYYLAGVDATDGEIEPAFAWLERAVAWGWDDAATAAWDADLAPLRDDPRFDALLARMRAALDERLERRPPPAIELEWPRSFSSELDPTGERMLLRGGDHAWIADTGTAEILAFLPAGERRIGPSRFSPDGELIATSGLDHGLRLWDAHTGEALLDFEGRALWARPIAFDPSGRQLLNWGPSPSDIRQCEVQRWDALTGEHLSTTSGLPGHRCQLDPTGTRAFVGGRSGEEEQSLELWDLEREVQLADFTGDVGFIDNQEVHFGPLGRHAVLHRRRSGDLLPVELESGSAGRPLRAGESSVTRVHVAGRPAAITAGDEVGDVRIWNAASLRLVRRIDAHDAPISRLALSPSGRWLLTYAKGEPALRCWNAGTGELAWEREVDQVRARPQICEEADRVLVATGWQESEQLRLADGAVLAVPELPVVDYPHFDLDGEGGRAVLYGRRAPARVVDTATGATRSHLPALEDAQFDPTGDALAVVDLEGRALVVDPDGGSERLALPAEGRVEAVVYSADGRRILGRLEESGAVLWDAASGARLSSLEVPGAVHWRTRWSRDGSRLIVVDDQHRLHLLHASDGTPAGEPLPIGQEPSDVALSPDGASMAVGTDDGRCRIWSLAEGEVVTELVHPDPFYDPDVRFVGFDLTGDRLVTTTGDAAVVRMWDLATGAELWNIDYYGGNPSTVLAMIDPTGERLYVHGMINQNSRVVDAGTGETEIDLADLDVGHLDAAPDGSSLFGIRERSLVAIDPGSVERRCTWTLFRSGELMRSSRRGWLDAPPRALRETALLVDRTYAPAEACAPVLLDPKRVDAEAAGVDVAPPHPFHVPRIVSDSPRRSPSTGGVGAVAARAEDPAGLLGFEVELDGELLPRAVVDAGTSLAEDGTWARLHLPVELAEDRDSALYRVRALARNGVGSRVLLVELER